ncbi:MAG: NAD(P)/FAD-dependent oxidoreductase [Clostridiales bacterium]|nr:NAD(P)/FAD-dependent oxidoreductase [Clostridiales bacterium]
MKQDVVIVGGGVAAVNAIKAIREVSSDINIHVIQHEPVYPYYRTRLTKNLFEDLDIDKILLQKKEWYEQNKVNLYLGKEVTSLDTDNSTVRLDDGSNLKYDKLLLANGSFNFKPPIEGIDKENVYTIRTFEDIQTIKANTEDKKTILHIGGGIQNLEAAWAFCSHGKEVIVAEFMDKLMPRQLDDRASQILKNAVEASNVKVLLGTQVVAITGEDKVSGAITKNGDTIHCDMVVYSVGIRPNKKLYENTAIKTNIGVIVNEHMQTNLENVYAAGDIAELDGKVMGLWPVAIEQGKIAGYNIVGKDATYYSSLPVTLMNAFNLSIFSVGIVDENSSSLTLTDDPGDGQSYKRIFIQDNIILGAIMIGDNKYNNLLKKFIENKTDISSINLSNISVADLLEQLKSL